jgi:hypothetical protein
VQLLTVRWKDLLCVIYRPLAIACLITEATDSFEMPCSWQYFDCNHTESCFCPLLALHPQQQSAMFSLVMIFSSLMMCSQLAADRLETLEDVNGVPQYTHTLSLVRTSVSNQVGMFQLLATAICFTHNSYSTDPPVRIFVIVKQGNSK